MILQINMIFIKKQKVIRKNQLPKIKLNQHTYFNKFIIHKKKIRNNVLKRNNLLINQLRINKFMMK